MSATKFLCVKTVSEKIVRHSLAYIRAKMIGRGGPLLPEILGQSDRFGAKSPIFDLLLLVAPQPYNVCSEKTSINTNRKSAKTKTGSRLKLTLLS